MDIKEQVESIEAEEAVAFSYNLKNERIVAEGKVSAVDKALERLRLFPRDQVAAVLRARLPIPEEEIVTREIARDVESLDVQRANYITWLAGKSMYYRPSEAELDLMWSRLEPGDKALFDFAHTISVLKPNGLLIAINRKGQIVEPSPYSPHVKKNEFRA